MTKSITIAVDAMGVTTHQEKLLMLLNYIIKKTKILILKYLVTKVLLKK